MKKLLVIISFLYFILPAAAQVPAGAPQMGNGGIQASPSIGHIYGKITDNTGKAIRNASIFILQSKMDTATGIIKDKLVKGGSTQANGEFNFTELPIVGTLTINISAIGYESLTKKVNFDVPKPTGGTPSGDNANLPDFTAKQGSFSKDLGAIKLSVSAKQLQDVVVSSNSSRLSMDIDKKVFNVSKNIVSAGGTAVDVIKNVPSVNVDIDGNVTMRNATPQLYIDGRPTTLSLDQIPADAIENVEVITNPSAKYDASGGNAGILNIVLKKNKKSGYNGNANVGVDKRGGLNGGASLNVRQDKINFSLSAFGNQMKNINTGTTAIQDLLSSPNLLVNQNSRTKMNGGFLFGRAGLDYFVTNRTTLSIGYIRVHGSMKPKDFLTADSTYQNGNYISYSERNTNTNRIFNANGLQAGFKHVFPRKGEELTADINFFSGKNTNDAFYNTDIYSSKNGLYQGNTQQHILGSGTNQFTTVQTDYVRALGAKAKLEAGARVQLRNLTNAQGNYILNSSGEFELIANSSANYKNNDNVYAGYISFSNSIKNFGYKLGLRGESSDYTGELTDTKQTFSNKYPINLFPSVFLSQKLKDKQELQLSFTRRVNRPFFMQVIPFIDSSDNLNWTRGNASLKPEFTNSIEASYSKTFKGNNTFLASVYYKRSTDLITRYLDTITVGAESHPVNTYINANSARLAGIELTSQNTLSKWWDLNSNVNIYNSYINTDNIDGTSQPAMWSYFVKVNNSFKLPQKFKVQLSGTYQSKTNLPVNNNSGMGGAGNPPPMGGSQSAAQGYIKSNYGIDLALQKSFLKNDAASVTFSINDVFGTRRYNQYSISDYYIQNTSRRNDVPMFRLNFTYRFGQMDMNLFKRKNTKGEAEGTQNIMQQIGN